MKVFFSRLLTLVMLSFFAVACGTNSSNVLSGMQVSTSTVDNDVMLSVAADINLGNMSFAAITLPIVHPHGQTTIGQVELAPVLGGKNQIKVSVNVSSLVSVRTSQAVLPNGGMIPLIASNETIAVELGAGARLYLTISDTATAIGVAVPIKAFDSLGSNLGGLNFFPVTNVNGVNAAAGIFTSRNSGQNGIAVVADVSRFVNLGNIFPADSEPVVEIMRMQAQEEIVILSSKSVVPSKATQNKLDDLLYGMHLKRVKLSPKK